MKNTGIICALSAVPFVAIAGVGQDILEREPGAGDGMPDWLIFLLLLFVILMVLGKIK